MNYKDDSLMLHTDLYQINMANVYWKQNIHEDEAVFELFFRNLPLGNGYAVFAGLEKIISYLKDFRYTDEDIRYLKEEVGYEDDFLNCLKELRFTGTLKSMEEGELVFGNQPILQFTGPLIQGQLIETTILNIVNYQTLIATKASRIKNVIGDDRALEFGTRRAQETEAAIWGARAAVIGGFDATSNVRAGKKFGIPVAGTHAHALVQVYRDEYKAFKSYAETFKDCVFLVDTYDTLKSGIPNAIKVANEMGDRINFNGIRLDSGDMAYLSKKARVMLDEAGYPNARIVASNDLDENTIFDLKSQGAMIDTWGVGTKLITSYDQPALGAVYKLVSIEDKSGDMVDTIKISGNPEKVTTPGKKSVYRILNLENGKSEGDYISLDTEDPNSEERLHMFHPIHTFVSKFITNFEAIELQKVIFDNGNLVYELPKLYEMQEFLKQNLTSLWPEYTRKLNPQEYPVDLSEKLWKNKMNTIEQVKKEVEEKMISRENEI